MAAPRTPWTRPWVRYSEFGWCTVAAQRPRRVAGVSTIFLLFAGRKGVPFPTYTPMGGTGFFVLGGGSERGYVNFREHTF